MPASSAIETKAEKPETTRPTAEADKAGEAEFKEIPEGEETTEEKAEEDTPADVEEPEDESKDAAEEEEDDEDEV